MIDPTQPDRPDGRRAAGPSATVAGLFAAFSIVLIYPVLMEYLQTGLVPRLPTAVLSAVSMLAAMVSFACGLILETVTLGRREMKRLRYLAYESVEGARDKAEIKETAPS